MSRSNSVFTNIVDNQADDRIRRYNRILEGINRIFSNVVQAKTEEELGNACLSVALEVTGSQFGFVGEIGADGLLHDIAISDMGWEKCLMYDRTGHSHPPGDFVLHGLYGRVVDSGKSFFTNEPSSHPYSVGLPSGHPSLTSFLGVPLIQDQKVIGMIAVANHEGGYSCEQQEDLEAIAPAMMQALQRKKEEQERMKAQEALQKNEAELARAQQISQIGSWTWDLVTNELTWSEQSYRNYGLAPGEVKPSYELFLSFIVPEDRKRVCREIEKAIESGHKYNVTYNIIRRDGTPRILLSENEIVTDESGKVVLMYGTNQDITARKGVEEELKKALETLRYSEDQFRGLFQNVRSGVALIDETGRFAVVNPSFMQMFGLDNELDILNINSQDWSRWEVYGEDGKLLHVDDHPVRKAVKTGKPVKGQLVAVRNPGANELTWMLIKRRTGPERRRPHIQGNLHLP
ncbi:GAF domain-containing protein [Methanosarcina sp.]|uniref:GAF domain-containing protein n=1 Tax=Methanosarcina sp. TaxID=2213 RepID=UPI002ABA0000|nr:GAF domain-containing protein [Methanosarcina sp.]MDY9927175.1 GAF domain-containing protein [Methanosarcina sp.]